jgi:tRNA(Ile)-lysidine synthase
MPPSLFEDVKSVIVRYGMLRKGDKVLVGLSGGPDSVTLLHILHRLKAEYELCLFAAHLDHKFRGRESREDRIFCEEMGAKMGVPVYAGEADVPNMVRNTGLSAEEAARRARYRFFQDTASREGIQVLAVGHNRDDQAETVLMRLIRGAGFSGLSAIRPVSSAGTLKVIRPLIESSRSEIEYFIKNRGIPFRKDSSNDKLIYTRNKLRHELIPYIEKNFNPSVKEVLAGTAEIIREEDDFIKRYARRKFNAVVKDRNDFLTVDLKRLKKEHIAIRKRIIRMALCEAKGDLRRFTYRHWRELKELMESRPTGSVVDLPCGIDAVKKKDAIVFKRASTGGLNIGDSR